MMYWNSPNTNWARNEVTPASRTTLQGFTVPNRATNMPTK